jgi:hypothetical protein
MQYLAPLMRFGSLLSLTTPNLDPFNSLTIHFFAILLESLLVARQLRVGRHGVVNLEFSSGRNPSRHHP